MNWHKTLPPGSFSYKENLFPDSVESSQRRELWLRVKLVGVLVMENRCGNGLVLYPPWAASPAVMKNNGFIPEGRGPQSDPSSSSSSSRPPLANLQRLFWQANRWLGWVASGLCALSVIKERKKVYGLLVSVLPTDGMSNKHPAVPNLWRDRGGGVEGVGVGCNLPSWKQPTGFRYRIIFCSAVRQSGCTSENESNTTDVWIFMMVFT